MAKRAGPPQYTPQEAAALTGVPLQRIQNVLTERRLGRDFPISADGRRHIDLPALLTFATLDRLEKVRIEPETLYRAFLESGPPLGMVPIGECLAIDAGRLLEAVMRDVELYEAAKDLIASDPKIMGGLPVVKGTRLPARTIHARVIGGDSFASILDDYPYLDLPAIDAAVRFVAANPERGRPRRHAVAVDV